MRFTEFKKQRCLKGLSQLELMMRTGISNSRISWIENGYRKPNPAEKQKLSKALGVLEKVLFPEDK
jgi:transcriptional regulator with XRE-family HTH domain